MASRFKLARAAAGIVGATATLLLTATVPASADPASGVVDGGTDGHRVNVGDDVLRNAPTALVGFRLSDGSELGMYCVEINTNIAAGQEMIEQSWDAYPNESSPFNQNRDRINWILHNSFPVLSTEELAGVLTDGGATLNNGLSTEEAIAGTQAAIWHFSDATDLNREDPLPEESGASADMDVLALYDHLIGEENEGMSDQPDAALEVDPAKLSGKAGERIGPFKVTTTGTIDELRADLPAGVKITDLDGVELAAEQIKNGAELFFEVPADSAADSASFELTANASVGTGRVFVGEDYDENPTQSLIVAQAEEAELTANASAEWSEVDAAAAPAPQAKNAADDEDLATTGASILAPVVIGGALLAAGIGALLFLRRRRA